MEKKKLFTISVLLLLAAGIWIGSFVCHKAFSYKKAVELMETGDADNAYKEFKKLAGYKDAEQKLSELEQADPALPYRSCMRKDIVKFGKYEQNNDSSDGPEPIEWLVIDRIEDEVLLISLYCLEYRTYNDVPFEPVTWENCAIRKWLNHDFYNSAFSEGEKRLMMVRENQNPDQSAAGTEGGADTEDLVYLLSEKEAGIYMSDEMDQDYVGKAFATEYVAALGALTDKDGLTEWWLRTPGAYEYAAQFVDTAGEIYTAGAYVDLAYSVRPVIWLKV